MHLPLTCGASLNVNYFLCKQHIQVYKLLRLQSKMVMLPVTYLSAEFTEKVVDEVSGIRFTLGQGEVD